MKKCIILIVSLFVATIVNAQLSGTYTINTNASQNPSYTSLSAAASALSAGVSGNEVAVTVGTATFEDVTLGANGYWVGEEGENEIYSGGWMFTNYYSSYFWGGFTASNHTDLTQTGLNAQYTAVTGEGTITPPDLPPYIAHPVGTIVMDEYPLMTIHEITSVATDPDDPDEDIVYSFISNSNETDLNAYLADPNGRFLILQRLTNKDATATLVLRASSDGQYVDFEVQVQMIYVSPQGVDENEYVVSVYPNPTNGLLNINVENSNHFNYQIFNMIGQNVMNGDIDGSEAKVDVSNLEKGVYFISVFDGNQKFVERIVVK